MTQLLHPQLKTSAKLIMLVGAPDISFSLPLHTNVTGRLQLREFNHSFKASAWLQEQLQNLENPKLPYAIIANYDFLANDNFRFLDSVTAVEELRNIPFITFGHELTAKERAIALKRGIDDCFATPISWDIVENRIRFLKQFKTSMINYSETIEAEAFEYKMPLRKRIFDLIFATVALICLFPFFLIIGIAIKLESKGKIVYSAPRVGTGYQMFKFLKFRSMYPDADKRLAELQHLNQYKEGENAAFMKFHNDPRVTKVGRYIRKSSIDELPQLVNVLKGDMSIVGNRPLPPYEAELVTRDDWALRFSAPAGITGLWQTDKRGKDNLTADERAALDVAYATKKYSMWRDIKIIARTIPALLQNSKM